MEKLKKAESALIQAESALLVALLGVMVTLSFAQVVLRQAFSTGILWADTLLRHLVLWVGFLGAALAAAQSKHFAWEPAAHKEGLTGLWLKLIANASAVAICAALVKASWGFFLDERDAGDILFSIGAVNVPAWMFSTIIPLGFALMLLHLALRAVEAACALKNGRGY